MERLNGTAYVILGMLGLGARTGYDIKRIVDQSTRFFWAASYGQIYPELVVSRRPAWSRERALPRALGSERSTA